MESVHVRCGTSVGRWTKGTCRAPRLADVEADSVGLPVLTVGYQLKSKPAHRRPGPIHAARSHSVSVPRRQLGA